MTIRPGRAGTAALMVAHCAGMIDLVALPVWVGALVAQSHFDPQQAGLLASLFLIGAVAASLGLASRMQRVRARGVAVAGYGLAALAFGALTQLDALGPMALAHVVAGLGVGAGLSATHGTIARSVQPHRLFAYVGMALGVFAVIFLGATPGLIAMHGTAALFVVFAVLMAIAALMSVVAFPDTAAAQGQRTVAAPIPSAAWLGMAGICAMALVQSMVFSFLERVGAERGFGLEAITGVLIALGLVNLAPAGLAAWLENRFSALHVTRIGAVLQALLAFVIMTASSFAPYAAAASVFAAVMIFTHTFAFGHIAAQDRSGRLLAATPAILMAGSAIGPLLGGTLVKYLGYEALGAAALVIGLVALICFHRAGADVAERGTVPSA